jgi:two-component system chemotaxis sensor kinase CheA
MDPTFACLLDDFLADADSSVERISDDAHMLVSRAGAVDEAALQRLRRDIHTLKGNASMMELDALVTIAHAMEDLCTRIESGDESAAGRVDEGAALMGALLARLRETRGAFSGGELATAFARRCSTSADETPPRVVGIADGLGTDESIRVDFLALERLSNLATEATTISASLTRTERGGEGSVEEDLASLSTTLRALRDGLAQMRLVPVGRLLRRFERYVRDVARQQGTDVRLTTTGAHTLLDKALLDRLQEPLLHLIRNAIAHGIEPSAERQRSGKPASATLAIDTRIVQGRAQITVTDDGRGLQMDAIISRARSLGLDVARLGDADLRRLVFLPGLSTAASVSEMAGRGIGLDAVRMALQSMRGDIDVTSSAGVGTSFAISVPVASAVVRGVLVEVDGETWLAPFEGLRAALPFVPGSVRRIDGVDVIREGEGLLPVVDGGSLLGQGDARGEQRRMCVVLRAGERERGLLVDRVLAPGEFVVKRLDRRLQVSRSFGGAVVLGDGRVALVVDPHTLGMAHS